MKLEPRIRREPPGSPRQVWCFEGRRFCPGVALGRYCYIWNRYLAEPDPVTGFTMQTYAHPVDTFWPPLAVRDDPGGHVCYLARQ
jgi:hypothetical protein